jgi:photosystem II stability/assembly factor-like uncharacterized protein
MYIKRAFLLIITLLLVGGMFSSGFGSAGLAASEFVSPARPDTLLFSDDFEGTTRSWDRDENFIVEKEYSSQNFVFEGTSHAWATLVTGKPWSDYTVEVKVKLLDQGSSVHLMIRLNDNRGRYIVGFNQGEVYLERENPWGNFAGGLANAPGPYDLNRWYTLSVNADMRDITVSVDGSQVLSYKDTSSTSIIWSGTVGLEVVGPDGLKARFDDVTVTGSLPPDDLWIKTGGPIGGLGYDVRYGSADQQVMYVTDNYSGVNKSNNGGVSWFATNRGITGRAGTSGDAIPVFTLNMDPNSDNNVWAGLKDAKGAYKSTTAGQLWEEVTPDATVLPEAEFVFRGFAVEEGNSNLVYAAGELPMHNIGKSFDKVRGRVYKTVDGGAHWDQLWDGDNLARYVIVHPNNPQIIYVSLGIFDRESHTSDCKQSPPVPGFGGVLRTKNGSPPFEVLGASQGLTDPYVGSLVMHPTDPDILLAGTGNVSCSRYWDGMKWVVSSGVFRTTNGGDDWNKTLADDLITAVEFAPSDPRIAYAGGQTKFYRSEDGGETWKLVAGASFPWGPPGVVAGWPIDILVSPTDPNTLFVNNYGGGNVKSTDGGITWTLASQGYTGALMFDVEVHPLNNATVYATARSGTFHSSNGGSSWRGLAYPPALFDESYAVALNPHDPQVVLSGPVRSGALYRSSDGGSSWTKVYQLAGAVSGDPNAQHGFKRFAFAPVNTGNQVVVYAGSCRDHVRLQEGVKTSFGVFKSTDGGVTWFEANDSDTQDECINDLAVHPTNPDIVYAATAASGLFKTSDGGSSWTPLTGLSVPDVRSVAIKPDQPNVIYAGAQNGVVYRSTNEGTNWGNMDAGMDPNEAIWSLEVDPVNTEVVWAGSNRTGVYRWDASQGLWMHVNAGLRTRAVTDLAISSDGEVLYATTWGEGVFRLGEVVIPASDHSVFIPLALR